MTGTSISLLDTLDKYYASLCRYEAQLEKWAQMMETLEKPLFARPEENEFREDYYHSIRLHTPGRN